MTEIISTSIPSSLEAMGTCIHTAIDRLSHEVKLNKKELFDIKLVLEEAITNAIRHGNKSQPDLKVDISIVLDGVSLIITIRDQGEGFDFKNVPNPKDKGRIMMTSGRGVFLIRKIMDEVQYCDSGRTLRIVKMVDQDQKKKEG